MTPEERRRTLALLDALTASHSTQEATIEGEVLQVVNEILRGQGSGAIPFPVLKRQRYYSSFREGSRIVEEYARDTIGARGRPEMRKVLLVLVKMLVRRLRKEKVPISPGTIAVHLKRVPDVAEDSFPGYRSSGVLRHLITSYKVTV